MGHHRQLGIDARKAAIGDGEGGGEAHQVFMLMAVCSIASAVVIILALAL